jgi:hypothetical protein
MRASTLRLLGQHSLGSMMIKVPLGCGTPPQLC